MHVGFKLCSVHTSSLKKFFSLTYNHVAKLASQNLLEAHVITGVDAEASLGASLRELTEAAVYR